MMRTVQLEIADAAFVAALRDALCHSGPWHVEAVEVPDLTRPGVVVVDEASFERLPLPLAHPERLVLISHPNPDLLSRAWDAGIVSVVSPDDSLPTVLLAIMATALRAAKPQDAGLPREISRRPETVSAQITPQSPISHPKRCRTQ